VQAFDALNLPDTQLFAAFGLLDRFAAASPAPISAGPGAFALVLAAMLVALKATGTQRELERAKRLVAEVSGTSRPWAAVRKAELCILRRLGFRACTPTSRDLLDRLLGEASQAAVRTSQDASAWDMDSRARCADLARFLLELGLVHEPETLYGLGNPPLTAALAALLLALLALGAPRQCADALREPARLLDGGLTAAELAAEAMRQRWSAEERRAAGGGGSAVLEKWLRRVGSFGASPPAAGELRYLTAGVGAAQEAQAPKESARAKPSPPAALRRASTALCCREAGNGSGATNSEEAVATKPSPPTTARRAGRNSSEGGTAAVELLAALPTPARRAAGLGPGSTIEALNSQEQQQPVGGSGAANFAHATQRPAQSSGARSVVVGPTGAQEEVAQQPQHLPTPRPVGGLAVATGSVPPSLASQLPHAAESLSTWPAAVSSGVEALPSPMHEQRSLACATQAQGAAAAQPSTGSPEMHPERQPMERPLVELTHVLNMVAPRPTHGPPAGHAIGPGASHMASATKQKPPSVAAELLISSALRMQWPHDRRKVGSTDAALTCREAAEVLKEAAAQLLGAASALDGGACPAAKGLCCSSESKRRRRTFGGPSPARVVSPGGGGGHALQRGSPPMRFAGLRV